MYVKGKTWPTTQSMLKLHDNKRRTKGLLIEDFNFLQYGV